MYIPNSFNDIGWCYPTIWCKNTHVKADVAEEQNANFDYNS